MSDDDTLTKDGVDRMLAELRSNGGPSQATREFNAALIAELRANGGRAPGELDAHGFKFLLLTMTGARSGKPRTVPLGYVKVSGRLFILASKGGNDTHPLWFYNIVANPDVTVELGPEQFRARAIVLERETRDEMFARIAEKAPMFREYQARTERAIPVIELVRAPS